VNSCADYKQVFFDLAANEINQQNCFAEERKKQVYYYVYERHFCLAL